MSKIIVLAGVGALGVSYNSCPYWRRISGNPSIHLSLWFCKIIIYLPFNHVTPIGHGSSVSRYGFFWWPKLRPKPTFYWETLTK